MFDRAEHRRAVSAALDNFRDARPREGARVLLNALGYNSEKTIQLDGTVSNFLTMVDREGKLSTNPRAQTQRWRSADFILQLTNDELPMLAQGHQDLFLGESDYHRSIIESFVFLTIELEDGEWTRRDLAEITRAVNRLFPMPAIIFFHYGDKLTLSVIPRRPNKRDSSRDVIEPTRKVALIKDVNLNNPHRAHLDILTDLHIQAGVAKKAPNNFDDLYKAWTGILSAEELNKRFYDRLSNWYLWAVGTVDNPNIMFPVAREVEENVSKEERHKLNQISVIRLLTRLIFVWFIKEKGLVPDGLFNTRQLQEMLAQDPEKHRDDSTYYKAILQNLFFATLNTQMEGDGRKWRSDQAETGRTPDYLISTLYRYKQAFRDPEQALQTFRKVPFLNGGLFECLDREVSNAELERNPDLQNWISAEGNQKVIRADGFSERKSNPLYVPNRIFFAVAEHGEDVDEALSEAYGKKRTGQKVDGLIRIFESYKFTVEENTPFDEEVALDPELLGKVFENLIASYNEDTSTTARKKSGSFYTPRVVVDYMVDEALVGYLEPALEKPKQPDDQGLQRHKNINEAFDLGPAPGELHLPLDNGSTNTSDERLAPSTTEARLRALLGYEDTETTFSEDEKVRLIARIESIRAIDPACGSGAFPMGLLQKLIHVLKRLDPDNVRWKAALREPLEKQLALAEASPDIGAKSEQIEALRDQLKKLDDDFSETSDFPDYARKLYVIDKCIHGVDIQPIAVQIAKLRFFISLVVSQKTDETAENLNITPLPNLETRLVAANALRPIERAKQHELFRNDEIENTEKALAEANERYFGARNRRTKNRAKQLIGELREKLSDLLQEANDLPKETARLIARWDPFDQNASANFFDPEWMFGLTEKFNIVIANPPYVRHEKIGEDKAWLKARYDTLKKKQSKNAKFLPEGLYQSFAGTADYLVYFMERGLDMLEPGGSFVFITSNKWYRAAYGANIRRWMGRASRIRSIIDFGDADVFDAIAYPTIIVAQRRAQILEQPRKEDVLLAWNWPSDMGRKEIPEFPEFFRSHAFQVPQKALDDAKGWQLEPQVKRDLLERILNAGKPLSDLIDGELYRGITTGFNDAFVVDSDQRKHLIQEHSSAKELLVPFIRGKDIERWSSVESDLWLIKIPSSENVKHPWTGQDLQTAERVFEDSYPSIYRHMIQFRSELVKRYDQGHFFWELRSCRYWDDFSEPKIISTKVSFSPTFALDKTGSVLSNTAYFFAAGSYPNLILSVLNSAVSNFLSQYLFATKQGGFYEVQPDGLKRIPIPTSSNADAYFKAIQLTEFARLDPRFEQLLNGLVYELFFPDELHARNIALFHACERAGLGQLEGLEGDALKDRAEALAREIFAPSHEIYRMLFDLRAIDVVRIIEGEE